jgi:NET1-associated nuclear protein 1 (U3 small nucleolar RNA-associated protein 17)
VLKRKREIAELSSKKAKKQRKSDAAQVNGDFGADNTATPTKKSRREKIKEEGNTSKAKEGLANGVHEESVAANGTPTSSSRKEPKSRKDKKKLNNEETQTTVDQILTPEIISTVDKSEKLPNGAAPHDQSEQTTAKNTRKNKGGKRTANGKQQAQEDKQETVVTNVEPQVEGTSESKKQRKARKEQRKTKSRPTAAWSISAPLGGWFLPQDPVFASDEKYLILANTRALQVYSTETSLLANTLPVSSGSLSTYALSTTNPNNLYTANSSGLITLWDWTEGKKIGRWEIGSNVRQMTVVPQPDSQLDLIYCHEIGSKHIINVHALRTRSHGSPTELKQIFKTKYPITGFQVLSEGKIVIATTKKSVAIGKRSKVHKTALQDFEYIWREFQISKPATTFDGYLRIPAKSEKKQNQAHDQRDHLDLAVGDEEGVIHLFEDILSSLAAIEKSTKTGPKTDTNLETLRPKRLHWHRQAVGSVKWSRDGMYFCQITRHFR